MKTLSILLTKLSAAALRMIGRGGSLPGSIGLKLDSNILKKLKFDGPVVLVTGTNGKTSTANMIADLFIHAGYRVVTNRRGDNLKAGITTTLLTGSTVSGHVQADVCVLEVDELNVRHILPNVPVTTLVVNNFFRDQLDRAREMEQLIESIEKVIPEYKGTLILNGNDPNVVRLAYKAPEAQRIFFGMDQNKYSLASTTEASEGKFCPQCGHPLKYRYYQYSHIGSFGCTNCSYETPACDILLKNIDLDANTFTCGGITYHSPYEGMYSMYNCAAVFAVAKQYDIDPQTADKVFENAPKPRGRNEKFVKETKECILNLVKNPTGANEVMKVIEKDPEDKLVCIVLNDNEQDGTDVSWIYDTFFEKICRESTKKIICTGTRAYDMALRIYYENYKGEIEVMEEMTAAIAKSLREKERCYVIATYTALLPARNAIVKEMGV